jgi:hypothetical protein
MCEWRGVRICCHDSPHDEAARPCLRTFHTASEGEFFEVGLPAAVAAIRARAGLRKDSIVPCADPTVRGGLAWGCSLEGFTRLPEGPLQSIAAIRDDCGQPIWFPQGVWHVPGEDLERVGTAVAALLGRADQVRKRDLTLPDDVTIFQGPRGRQSLTCTTSTRSPQASI